MDFPDPYASPPQPDTFSPGPLPVAPEDDSMAQWAQVAGYVQPEPVDAINFNFESLDALFPWEQGGMLPEPQLGGELGLDWATILAGHLSDTRPAVTAPVPVPPPLPTNINLDELLLDFEWDSTLPFTPVLTEDSSVPSPDSDSSGGQPLPVPTYEAAASQFAAPFPTLDFSGIVQPEQACTLPSWLMGDDTNFSMQTQLSYAHLMGMHGSPYHIETNPKNTSMEGASTDVQASATVLGKRSRESSSYELPQKKGETTTDGVLEAAGSTKRARPALATKTQSKHNDKSKAVGRGAGKLASTTARGVYRRTLLGHSVPQGSVGTLAQGQPPWTEEREQEETRHDTSWSSLPQGLQNPEIAEDMEAIPEKLTAWQRLLLETTEADLERGTVRTIKCRLCPTERFKTWACFGRHCRDCEEHPEKINCCERCGIYFGRQDSMKRHKDSATKACCATTPAEAAWRMHRAEQLLAVFQKRVEDCLRTGEELGPKFAAIAGAELPSKSKKTILLKRTRSGGNNSQDSDGR